MSLRIGIDVGGTKIEGIALHGTAEAARLRVPTPRDEYLKRLAKAVRAPPKLAPWQLDATPADAAAFLTAPLPPDRGEPDE